MLEQKIDAQGNRLDRRINGVDARINTMVWMVGTTITPVLLVLGKLFLAPS